MVPKEDRLLDLDTRRRVFRYVQENPGMHLRGIQRALEMPLGTVEYHLHQMEKNGLLSTREDGRFKAFFVKEDLDRRDKDVLYYVRQENPRRIVIHLLQAPGATHKAVVEALPVGPSTVTFHLDKLVKAGLVRGERDGRTKRFFVSDPDRAAAVLVRYRKSFLDDLVDRFAGSWLGLGPPEAAEGKTDAGGEGGESVPPQQDGREDTEPDDHARDEAPGGSGAEDGTGARPRADLATSLWSAVAACFKGMLKARPAAAGTDPPWRPRRAPLHRRPPRRG